MVGLSRAMAFGLVLAAIGVAVASQTQPLRSPEKRVTKGEASLSTEKPSTANKETNTAPNVTVIVKQEQPSDKNHHEEDTDENIKIQRKLATFTGLLVLIAAVTAGFIGWQAYETRRAVQATREAAEAARDSAIALINSERAWIDGEIIGNKIPGVRLIRYSLKLTNHGKTAARVLGYDVQHGFLSEGADFSNEALTTHFSEEAHLLIGSTETKTIRDDWNMEDIYANPPHVLSRGAFRVTIQYRDIVGVNSNVHETKLHFVYKVFSAELTPMYEYNEYA